MNGAGPCAAIVVELLLDDELDEVLDDEELDDDEFVAATCPPIEAGIVESAVSGTVVAGVAGALVAGVVVSRADVSGPTLVIGAADVDGTADVSDAIDVDGSVAGASVSSALPLSSRIPPAMIGGERCASGDAGAAATDSAGPGEHGAVGAGRIELGGADGGGAALQRDREVVVERFEVGHRRSPSSRGLSRRRASCRCDFTEPSAMSSVTAISAIDSPST